MWLETGSLKVPYNVPMERLLGFAREGPTIPMGTQHQSAGGSTAEALFGRGSAVGPPYVNPSADA
eukprot:scaffold668754_cov122-Attheya_sp.AAC.1